MYGRNQLRVYSFNAMKTVTIVSVGIVKSIVKIPTIGD